MKLNLGCGDDIRPGYTNVDFRERPGVDRVADLSKFPWPFEDDSVTEIMMLDFLEHFRYADTECILKECHRILKTGSELFVQVPDFEQCARAALSLYPFQCNKCGYEFTAISGPRNLPREQYLKCVCGQTRVQIQDAAIHRLYGGQDYPGNFHYTAFSSNILQRMMENCGFDNIYEIEKNQNGETMRQNWNIKLSGCAVQDMTWKED